LPLNDSEISAKRLHELVRYNRQTGEFTWRVLNRWRKPGPIGTLHHGYLVARFDDRLYRLHRLAWLYVTGEMPPEETDHINGRRSDNRFVNLRLSSHAQNQQNRPKTRTTIPDTKASVFANQQDDGEQRFQRTARRRALAVSIQNKKPTTHTARQRVTYMGHSPASR
jgi:HNH endonuclease